jgi:Cu(I)/Ag(I) efflux system membrane fusion protein
MNRTTRSVILLLLAASSALVLPGCRDRKSADALEDQGAPISEPSADVTVTGIELSAASRALAEIRTEPVRYGEVRDRTHATGEIQVNGRRVARIASRLPGWVEGVRRIQGDPVRRGDIVLTIHSPEYQTAEGELFSARNRLDKAGAKGDATEIETARAIYASARKRLILFGESAEELDALLRAGEVSPVAHIHSPFDGTILESAMVPGHRVEAGTEVCLISDLRTVWALLNVFEKDLASVRVGSGVSVTVGAYPDDVFTGTVALVDNMMDEATRTVKVRVEVPNQEGRLKPGMFADGDIDRGPARQALVVPTEALQQEGMTRFVFVARNGRFCRQDVDPGVAFGTQVEVTRGLQEGDSVVTGGAFTLKSEMLKSGFGEGGD